MRNIKPENKDELIKHMQEKSDEELLKILTNKNEYDTDVFSAALNISTERNLAGISIYPKNQKEQDETQWYYKKFRKEHGPITKSKIKELIESKEVDKYTKVWKKGFEKWAFIDETELDELFKSDKPPQSSVGNIFMFLFGRVFNLVFISIIALTIFYVGGWDILWGEKVTFFDYLLVDEGLKIRSNLIAFGFDGKYYGFLNAKRFFDASFVSFFMLFISLGVFYYALKHFFFGVKDD